MKLRDGFIARDSYGDWKYFPERPTNQEWSSMWTAKEDYNIPKAMFEDLPDVEWGDSLRQILDGKIILPLPELEVDAKVLVYGQPAHFSHWDDAGRLNFFIGGKTSWTAEGNTDTAAEWKLPDAS